MKRIWLIGFVLAFVGELLPVNAQDNPAPTYWVYVAAESEDEVALVRFGPGGASIEKTIPVGVWPTEIEGPHGIRVSPDGEHWYLSLTHGNPFGSVYKYRTGTDDPVASVEVGMFPATLDVAASTNLLYVVNFDLHGDMEPSTISVVETGDMIEVAQIEVGIMPHSSRLSRSGEWQYSVMMMTDELVELDAFGFEVRRRLSLSDVATGGDGAREDGVRPMTAMAKPTWVQPSPDGRFVYVSCNGSNEVKEVDLERWEITRTFETPAGPYNLDVTADGRLLVVSYKGDGSTGVWDLQKGEEIARIENTREVTHGVALSPDSNYAFVSVEGIGGEPGALDVIDLNALRLVASVDVGKQASGIAFWKMD